jgi:hypothetical protein
MKLVDRAKFSLLEEANATLASHLKSVSEAGGDRRPRGHMPPWCEPVRQGIDNVNVEEMRQARQAREAEQALERQLGRQLIDIGYEALATKLHPDRTHCWLP